MNSNYSKADIKLDYGKYTRFMYTGFNHLLMLINHYLLEIGINVKHNRNILEVGGGTNPHFTSIKKKVYETYLITDVQNYIEHFPDKVRFIPLSDLDPKLYQNHFSRIIASHVWEHVEDPEYQLLQWCSMLADDGILSIALPCDPGLFWHLCRWISYPKARKVYGITREERNLIMSREHINSIYNLLYIVDYYFEQKKILRFPALIPINNLNLLCIIQLNMQYFRKREKSI